MISSLPLDRIPQGGIFTFDKLLHIVEYTVYTFSIAVALRTFESEKIEKYMLLIACLIAILYGASDEFHQIFVNGRSASILDWFADIIGALIGTFLYTRIRDYKWLNTWLGYDQAD